MSMPDITAVEVRTPCANDACQYTMGWVEATLASAVGGLCTGCALAVGAFYEGELITPVREADLAPQEVR